MSLRMKEKKGFSMLERVNKLNVQDAKQFENHPIDFEINSAGNR